jgi:phospholipid/cholesterol/gamma-HCH transport system substrate-binding protein
VARQARLVGVGVFVLGGLLLFSLGLFLIGDRQMAFATTFTVYTEFSKITGLQPGAVVRVSGAKAGSVTQIVPPNSPTEKFRVQLEVIEDLHQLVRTNSVATIETEGLMGGSYLGIGTGTDDAAPIAVNGTIVGKDPFDIADLMQQLGDTITRANTTIDELKGGVQGTVQSIGTTVDNANTLITDVSDDLTRLVTAAAAITGDAAVISEGIRSGKGSLGKFVNDDELYTRMTAIATQTNDIATSTRLVIEKARDALDGFQSKDGPVQGMTADVAQTMGDARTAMAGFAENMEALKRNFLVRGFFNRRGFFDLAQMTPAQYRDGALTKDSDRRVVRVWRRSDELFEPEPDRPENEQLSESGKAWLDSAIAPYLEHIASGVVVVEGYAQMGTAGEQYLRSRTRGSIARAYLVNTFHLDPQTTGSIPLSADSTDSPGKVPWDGVALAVILPKASFAPRK